jgi:hypothetical protein
MVTDGATTICDSSNVQQSTYFHYYRENKQGVWTRTAEQAHLMPQTGTLISSTREQHANFHTTAS